MSELRHYVDRGTGVEVHVIELPPMFIGDAELEEFDRLQKKIIERGTQIRIDFRNVKHMNSTAWGMIITAYTRAQKNGGSLKLDASENAHIRNFLRLTGLERLNDPDDPTTGKAAAKPDRPDGATRPG